MNVTPQSLEVFLIAPEIVLALTAAVVLVADLFLPHEAKWLAMPISLAGMVGTLAALVALVGVDRGTFVTNGDPTWVVNEFALVFKFLFVAIGVLILGLSFHYFRTGEHYQGEYYFLLLVGVLGAMVMASARDLISIFIAIEMLSIPGFVMTGLRKRDAKSNEAALKFFLFGVMSSALMLWGMSLVYGATGETTIAGIRESIGNAGDEPIIVLSVFFLLVGFAFKISAVPFHFWAPDTYEGAPSPVAAFLSTASKVGGFVGVLVLMFGAFPAVADTWRPLFAVLAVLTMTVGNLIALRQQHIIRLLAYSGIAQSGYVLVALALVNPNSPDTNRQALTAAIVYLVIYALMDAGAFAAAVSFARRGGSYFISDYSGLWNRSPMLAALMATFLVSLAGAPPVAGFWAKVFVFIATINAEVYWLAVVMGVNAVIAAWYYLAVVKRMFFETSDVTDTVEVPYLLRAVMGVAAAALIVLTVYPAFISRFAEKSLL